MPRFSFRHAATALATADPHLAGVIAAVGPPRMRRPHDGEHPLFSALGRAIVYQQLAGKAAAAIHGRYAALFDGEPSPEAVLAAGEATLRTAGLSGSKAQAILDLAAHVARGELEAARLRRASDEEIITALTRVRGIGRWTAEMYLIFDLRRPDVWPVDDLGVRKGYALVHGLADLPAPKALVGLGEPYRPFRSIAAWYCWRAVDVLTP